MKKLVAADSISIPEEVTVTVKSRVVNVKGQRGELTKEFKHLNIDIYIATDETGEKRLVVESHWSSRKRIACIRTVLSHVRNMITGVTKGYRYKMRLVYAHFPINVSITDDAKQVQIRNFLGEKRVRVVDMLGDVKCIRSVALKDELIFEGNDIDNVGKSCALLTMQCRVKRKDIRKFLDGIYISGKGNIVEDS